MFKNLIETMGDISGASRPSTNSMSEIEKVLSVIFIIVYFLSSKFLNKISGLDMLISLSIVAVIFMFLAHQLDKKLPFPNKHFWKLIAVLLMVPVFLLAGV